MEHYQKQHGAGAVPQTDEYGHEKKGVVEQIKEKLPGSTTTQHEQGHEKKGMVDKIKEKVPGVGHTDDRPQHTVSTTTPGGYGGHGMSGEGQYQHEQGHEKKGVVDKIKENLPGGH